jgi:2-amino-4-hydroxy-6-hydroxymethyldihydropteridine diphosphokinase
MQACHGLVANLEHPVRQLEEALTRLGNAQGVEIKRYSSFYQTPPWGNEQQGDFINAVAEIETNLEPVELLRVVQAIENEMGRRRNDQRWGPRIIDIDVLLYADEILQSQELILPHPHMHERAFVLLPLLELDATIRIPGQGVVRELLSELECDGIYRLDDASEL